MVFSSPRRLGLRAAFAAVAFLCAGGVAQAQADGPPPAATARSGLTIVSRNPPEFRISGVSLKSVRADDTQNVVAFDFNGPVTDDAFAQLQAELPDWVEMAYAGYDNAVIRAKRPVTFMTKAEGDGFSMRIVARETAAAAPLRPSDTACTNCPPPVQDTRVWTRAAQFFARAAAERPTDVMIRAGYDSLRTGGVSYIAVNADWRHGKNATLYTGNVHAEVELWDGVRLMGDFHNVLLNAKLVRREATTITPLNKNDMSGAIGIGVPWDGAVVTAEALYGRSGVGGRLGVSGRYGDWWLGMRAAYHEPYTDTAEAISLRGERDYSAIFAAGEVWDGVWLSAEGRATRYGIHGDANVATTAGWKASLRWDLFDGLPLALTYDGDGEYVIHHDNYIGVAAPSPFTPLGIRNREVHQFGGDFSTPIDNAFWFDMYGGWAFDRYAKSGPFGGLGLRFTPGTGFDIALNGRYTKVGDYMGENGEEISAGLQLTYAWGGDAPIMHGGGRF